jgi:hypothetical protein
MEPGPNELAWKAAEAKAEAYEASRPAPKDAAVEIQEALKGAPEPPPAPEPDPKEEPEAAAEHTADDATDSETESTPAGSDKVKQLHALAKELGMKVDGQRVSVEERAGFRAEKRSWHEKQKTKEQALAREIQAAQSYFAPLGPAMDAVKSGDYDLAVRKLAEAARDEEVAREGLNGATKRYLKRAAGQDPRVDELERWKRQREAEDAERQQTEAQRQAEAEQQRQRQEFTVNVQKQLAETAEREAVKRLAAYPSFAAQVVARMEARWDGFETISPEDAAAEVADETRAVYDELHKVFGDQDARIPETPAETPVAGRSGKATAGKKPKPHNGKHATEASPQGGSMNSEAWRKKWAHALKQTTG